MSPPLLRVEDLAVRIRTRDGWVRALDGLSFALEAGETLALAGASGAGKSTAALAVAGLLDPAAEITGGSIRLRGRELRGLDARGWQAVRRQDLAVVFQQPRRALDPVRRIGDQLADALRAREGLRGAAARARAAELLAAMGADDPAAWLRARAHQLSGGQCQRALIALALTGRPALLLADEPTTALDPPAQAAVLALLAAQAQARGMATLWITHDLALAAQRADRVAVLAHGRLADRPPTAAAQDAGAPAAPIEPAATAAAVATDWRRSAAGGGRPAGGNAEAETGTGTETGAGAGTVAETAAGTSVAMEDRIRAGATGPWSGAMTGAGTGFVPASASTTGANADAGAYPGTTAADADADAVSVPPLLAVQGLRKRFGARIAVDGVDFRLGRGRTLGLVGESGAGKSTVAALVARLIDADGGSARLHDAPGAPGGAARRPDDAVDLLATPAAAAHRAPWRRRVQMVLQDPLDSLDPSARAFAAVARPLERLEGLRGAALAQRVREAADQARLPHDLLQRYPHQLSGGQAARVGIARALAVRPDLLILDEPTSALDAAVQEELLETLAGLRRATGTACLFISHDLRLVRRLCDEVLVMHRGRIVEHGPTDRVFDRPAHARTRALLAAAR